VKWVCQDQRVAQGFALKWAQERMPGCFPFDDKAKAIMLFEDDRLKAVTVFTDYYVRNVQMHIASDGSKNWMTRAFLRTSFGYPFLQLGVLRVTGLVAASNGDALRFDQHLGFRIEGRMRCASYDGSDLLVLGMLRQECRYITEAHDEQRLRAVSA